MKVTNAYQLLYRVAEILIEEPKRYWQDDWVLVGKQLIEKVDEKLITAAPSCGTVCCVAGWVVMLTDGKASAVNETRLGHTAQRARTILGGYAPRDESDGAYWPALDQLFAGGTHSNIPEDAKPGTLEYAEYGVARIAEFAEEWKARLEGIPVKGQDR